MKWSKEGLEGFARGILALVQENGQLGIEVADLRNKLEAERERRKAAEATSDMQAGNLVSLILTSPAVAHAISSDEILKPMFPPETETRQP